MGMKTYVLKAPNYSVLRPPAQPSVVERYVAATSARRAITHKNKRYRADISSTLLITLQIQTSGTRKREAVASFRFSSSARHSAGWESDFNCREKSISKNKRKGNVHFYEYSSFVSVSMRYTPLDQTVAIDRSCKEQNICHEIKSMPKAQTSGCRKIDFASNDKCGLVLFVWSFLQVVWNKMI